MNQNRNDKQRFATVHGQSGSECSPTYHSWLAMKKRCFYRKHPHYNRYGGKGITVCDRWRSFENFLVDMGPRPVGYSLDRIDGTKNYEPANCRWATPLEQGSNRSNLRLITANGLTLHLREWSRRTGILRQTISYRLRRGLSPEEALSV